jgi:hypothetical protein
LTTHSPNMIDSVNPVPRATPISKTSHKFIFISFVKKAGVLTRVEVTSLQSPRNDIGLTLLGSIPETLILTAFASGLSRQCRAS